MRKVLPGRPLPDPRSVSPDADGFVFAGGSLTPDTLIQAYQDGYFPWDWRKPFPWYSPDPRCVLRVDAFHASASLAKRARQGRFQVRYDHDLLGVVRACATVPRAGEPGTWITPRLERVYGALFEAGLAHTVEVWVDGLLVGGLFGLGLGAVFHGESMFARAPDASKLALWDLCLRFGAAGGVVIDCQAETPHLASLGAGGTSRDAYLTALPSWNATDVRWDAVIAAPGLRSRRRADG
ncbi:MAG: leucyl/phenylalanyl-tRNA--protein transferase [Pseudomonadota bacterium]